MTFYKNKNNYSIFFWLFFRPAAVFFPLFSPTGKTVGKNMDEKK
jgi:hypothetical protein